MNQWVRSCKNQSHASLFSNLFGSPFQPKLLLILGLVLQVQGFNGHLMYSQSGWNRNIICPGFLPIVLFLDFNIEDPVSSENHSSFITQLHIRTCYWIEKYSDQCWNCGCSAIHIGAFDKDLWLWDWPTYMGRDIITLKNIRTTVEIVAGLFKLGPLTSPCQAHMVFNLPPPARKSFKNQHRSNQTYPHSCILVISPFTIHSKFQEFQRSSLTLRESQRNQLKPIKSH